MQRSGFPWPSDSGGCVEVVGGNEARTKTLAVTDLDVLLVAEPAGSQAGGDVYCLHSCGHGTLAKLVLLDLTGHGMARDAMARTLHELLHQYSTETGPVQLLELMNQRYEHLGLRAILTTAVGAIFDPAQGLVRFANAGQPRPLHWSSAHGQWSLLMPVEESDCGLPLGVMATACYEEEVVPFSPDDMMIWFSDGLPETRNAAGEFLKPEGVLHLVQESTDALSPYSSLAALASGLLRQVEEFRGAPNSEDDLTLLWVRRLP